LAKNLTQIVLDQDFCKIRKNKFVKGTKFAYESLKEAVEKWVKDKSMAEEEYGHISDWDVSEVTSMEELFKDMKDFNEDLSRWNTGKVENMANMFDGASRFSSDLSDWNVSKVKKDKMSDICPCWSFNINEMVKKNPVLPHSHRSLWLEFLRHVRGAGEHHDLDLK